ncbi:MAG: FAD-binding oxidoreductase [Solirubrobacteraceae bacterium]
MSARQRKHWGWGYEDEQQSPAELQASAAGLRQHLGFGSEELVSPAPPRLPEVRLRPPAALAGICDDGVHARAFHARGASYVDVVQGMRGNFPHAPDFVAVPGDEREIAAVLEWCAAERVAAIPFGGGTSVVGGVEPRLSGDWNGAVSIDLARFDRVLEIDPVSRSARIQAGALGPSLEDQLGEMTLRHFPQSFQFSTLGGWIATRAGGHFATLWTHIDDLVESVRAVTPAGVWESRRLPGSGAGPSPDRMLLGSEGVLGVITEAWVRVQPAPRHRDGTGVRFADFERGAECLREIVQAGLHPSNCRLVDAAEVALTGAGDGSSALLVLGFESTGAEVATRMDRALEICAVHGGQWERAAGGRGAAAASWREAFLRAPYLRDTFVRMGVLAETFETAITWERLPALREDVFAAAREAAGPQARISCRVTHAYADGVAPYFTVLAPAERGDEAAQWAQIKAAASTALSAAGGTITHHHAVGRDHRPWYDQQRPEPFAMALRGAKAAVDPAGVLNPGVLI